MSISFDFKLYSVNNFLHIKYYFVKLNIRVKLNIHFADGTRIKEFGIFQDALTVGLFFSYGVADVF